MNKALEIYLSGNTKELDAALARADKKFKDLGSKLESIGSKMSIAFTAPLLAAGVASTKMASDMNESLNKVDVAFKNSSAEVKAFAKTTMKSFGIAEGTALDMTALFGDMATSMGLSTSQAAKMSTKLTGLAGDLASFKNISIDVAQTALTGIFTGETESLKRLGIVMTEENVKLWALQNGIKKAFDEMSQAEKTTTRFNYVLAQTTNSQGDFIRTQGGAANQMRIFQEGMKQLGTSFGQIVLPAVTDVISVLNGAIESLDNLGKGTKTAILAVGGIVALTGPLLFLAGTILPKVVEGFILVRSAVNAMGLSFSNIGPITAFIGLMVYATKKAYDYAASLSGVKGLSEQEKKDANAIREKNKELYKSIAAREKQKALAPEIITGMDTRATKASIQAQIDAEKQMIISNRTLLKAADELNKTNADGNEGKGKAVALTEEQIAAQQRLQTSYITLKNKLSEFKNEQEALFKDMQEWSKSQIVNAPQVGSTKELDQFQKANAEIIKKQQAQQFGTNLTPLDPVSAMTKNLQPTLDQLTLFYDSAKAQTDAFNAKITEMQSVTASAFESIGMSIVQSMGLGSSAIGQFVSSLAGMFIKMAAVNLAEKLFAKQKVQTKQAEATATAIQIGTDAAASTGPAAIFTLAPLIALAVGAISSAFSAVPAFAAGGIVSGPTMALMGEYPGAKSNPEVIAPLDKLQSMIDGNQGGATNVTGEFVVRGQDLVLALNRATKNYNRLT